MKHIKKSINCPNYGNLFSRFIRCTFCGLFVIRAHAFSNFYKYRIHIMNSMQLHGHSKLEICMLKIKCFANGQQPECFDQFNPSAISLQSLNHNFYCIFESILMHSGYPIWNCICVGCTKNKKLKILKVPQCENNKLKKNSL